MVVDWIVYPYQWNYFLTELIFSAGGGFYYPLYPAAQLRDAKLKYQVFCVPASFSV